MCSTAKEMTVDIPSVSLGLTFQSCFGYVNFASKDGVELALALPEEDLTIKNRILRVKRCTGTQKPNRSQNNTFQDRGRDVNQGRGGFQGRSQGRGGFQGRNQGGGDFQGRNQGDGGFQGRNQGGGGFRGRNPGRGGFQGRGGFRGRNQGGGFQGRNQGDGGFQRRNQGDGGYQGRNHEDGGFQGRNQDGGFQGRNQGFKGGFGRQNEEKIDFAYRRILKKRQNQEGGEGPPNKIQKTIDQPSREKKPRKEFVGMTAEKKKKQKFNKGDKKKKAISEILKKL